MNKQLIVAGILGIAGSLNSQTNTFPTSGNAGIGTTTPNRLLDVRGSTTFGSGAVEGNFGSWTPSGNERTLLLTGQNVNSSDAYGTLMLGSNANEAAGLWLGGLAFGQVCSGKTTSAAGLKAAIRGLSTGSGGSTGGYGAALVFCTNPDNAASIVPERMRITMDGNVAIGTTSPFARLHVVNSSATGGNVASISGEATGSGGSGSIVGSRGTAAGGASNVGGLFMGSAGSSGITTYGVWAEVINPTAGGTNYAVFGDVGGNNASGAGPNFAGYFDGDVVTVGGSYYYSDKRLKKGISAINNSLGVISKLNPVNYSFDCENNPFLSLPSEKQYGFISQEVKEILPELTKDLVHPAKLDEQGKEISPAKEVLGLNYNGFIALLTKGIQEQQQQIAKQQSQLERQQLQIDELKAAIATSSGKATDLGNIPLNSGNENAIVLDQNVPNPFSESTTISYNLPTGFTKAEIIFTNNNGATLKTVNIREAGRGKLTLLANDLSQGIYNYTLIVDGQKIDSKKIVKE